VSIIIVNYNSTADTLRCLESLYKHAYENYEVIVVDNASNEENNVDVIAETFPQVTLLRPEDNLGFGGGNNHGVAHATGDYLAFINPDTTVEPDWLAPLIDTLETQPDVGVATSKILMMDPPHRINTTGNFVHIAGFGYLRGWMKPATAFPKATDIFAISGAAFAMRRKLYEHIGGFDELFYPAYVEDIDLAWKVHLAGFRCMYVPTSIVYHDYTLTFNINKYTMLERHRQQMIVKNYRWLTLLVLLPALILGEIVTWGYAALNGSAHARAKLKSYNWFFSDWRKVMKARHETQRLRRVTDRTILKNMTHRLAYSQASEGLAAKVGMLVLDPLFYLWRRIALLIVRW
jgi:hypothetical protein